MRSLSRFAVGLPAAALVKQTSGSSSFGRAIAFQAIGGEFEPRLPLQREESKESGRPVQPGGRATDLNDSKKPL